MDSNDHTAEQLREKICILEVTFGYRFFLPSTTVKCDQTTFCVTMMSGGSETDNEVFIESGEDLDAAFNSVVESIKKYFATRPVIKPVKNVLDELKKL